MTFVFREPHTPVARWFLALRLQVLMLWVQLFSLVAIRPWRWWGPWLLASTGVVVGTAIWTAFGLRRARRAVDLRVEQALEGLLSQGDIKCDPDVVARLRALHWPP